MRGQITKTPNHTYREKKMSENEVKWHPYPKEKPKFYEPVLVTLLYHDGSEFVEIDILHCYQHLKIKEKWGFDRPDRKVIAWAELPEPYHNGG